MYEANYEIYGIDRSKASVEMNRLYGWPPEEDSGWYIDEVVDRLADGSFKTKYHGVVTLLEMVETGIFLTRSKNIIRDNSEASVVNKNISDLSCVDLEGFQKLKSGVHHAGHKTMKDVIACVAVQMQICVPAPATAVTLTGAVVEGFGQVADSIAEVIKAMKEDPDKRRRIMAIAREGQHAKSTL